MPHLVVTSPEVDAVLRHQLRDLRCGVGSEASRGTARAHRRPNYEVRRVKQHIEYASQTRRPDVNRRSQPCCLLHRSAMFRWFHRTAGALSEARSTGER